MGTTSWNPQTVSTEVACTLTKTARAAGKLASLPNVQTRTFTKQLLRTGKQTAVLFQMGRRAKCGPQEKQGFHMTMYVQFQFSPFSVYKSSSVTVTSMFLLKIDAIEVPLTFINMFTELFSPSQC